MILPPSPWQCRVLFVRRLLVAASRRNRYKSPLTAPVDFASPSRFFATPGLLNGRRPVFTRVKYGETARARRCYYHNASEQPEYRPARYYFVSRTVFINARPRR